MAMKQGNPKHFLQISDFDAHCLRFILDKSLSLKAKARPVLAGKILAMIFESPSTRTRVSFDVAMRQLGGQTLMLYGHELQIGRGESIADTAKVLSRYVDAIMIRILDHDKLQELAAHASIPVINGLTCKAHPTQILADLMTIEEHFGTLEGKVIAYSGDGNNMLASWIAAATKFRFTLRVATPPELSPDLELLQQAKQAGADIMLTSQPEEAVENADCVMTDTFVSMGDDEAERRHNMLMPYQMNAQLMRQAKPDAIFLHCLPAHRGEEVTAEVIDGSQSVVFDQAENRLHVHKGILAWALGDA